MTARSLLALLATAALGAFYLALAFVAAHPRTSAEYHDHYIDRVADCWLPDGLRSAGPALPAEVRFDQASYPEACLYLRLHWWPVGPSGAWTHPGVARLRLPWRPGAAAVELDLNGPEAASAPVAVELRLGADVIRTTLAEGEQRTVRMALPPSPDERPWVMQVRVDHGGTARRIAPREPPRNVGVGLLGLRYVGGGA